MQCGGARYFVHVGFMMKIVSGEYHGEGISYEGEVLAIMAQAQLAFGLGLRGIIAFGISVSPSFPLSLIQSRGLASREHYQ